MTTWHAKYGQPIRCPAVVGPAVPASLACAAMWGYNSWAHVSGMAVAKGIRGTLKRYIREAELLGLGVRPQPTDISM